MKLDRNVTGQNKYALVKVRDLEALVGTKRTEAFDALRVLDGLGILDRGSSIDSEFFVMRLKDRYAAGALAQYAFSAAEGDPEYACEIMDLAKRAGPFHPNCKDPD